MTLSVLSRATRSGGWCAKQRLRPVRRTQILRFLEDLPRGRVLDAPAGSLWLARALASRGFEVDAVDRLPDEQHAGGGGFVRYARGDLDEGLAQFADRTFDYVVCVEGLEHLERPALLVSLRSRVKFLLFGYHDGFRRRTLFRRFGAWSEPESPHITPLHLQFLYYWLAKIGFRQIRVHDIRVRSWERLVLFPLAALVAGLRHLGGHTSGEPHYDAYLTLLVSKPVLFSPTLVVTAQRAGPGEGRGDATRGRRFDP